MATDPGTLTLVPTDAQGSARAITYATTKDDVAALARQYAGIDARQDMEAARKARADMRGRRTAVEARRKELKAEALEFGRKVDAAAKELTALIAAVEDPIDSQIKAIETEEARAKFEKENAERLAREESERQAKAAEDARKEAELAAERERLAEVERQQGIERDRIEAEKARVAVEAKREAARIKKASDELAAREKAVRDAEAKVVADREAAERKAREEQAAKEQAERDRVAAEQAEAQRVAAEAAALARAEALKPDREKLAELANHLRRAVEMHTPTLTTPEAGEALDRAAADIEDVAMRLETFWS